MYDRHTHQSGSIATAGMLLLLTACWLPGCIFDSAGLPYQAGNNNTNDNVNVNDNTNGNVNNNTAAVCGDGVQEQPEVCDGDDLADADCVSQGFEGGVLTCRGDCAAYNTSACTGTGPECGDGAREGAELCDGTDLAGRTCVDEGFYMGTLACLTDCSGFDTSGCSGTCGDGTANGAELCDATDVGGRTCVDEGFYGGTLVCQGSCMGYDTTGCAGTCGDGAINGTEVCDGSAVGGRSCIDEGFYGGTLGCLSGCAGFDTAGCAGFCGDGAINGTELCDGNDVGARTCVDEGFYGGTLTCQTGCGAYDTTACSGVCGDGMINGTEECDGGALGGTTCANLGCRAGALTCTTACTFDVTSCYSGHDEDADGVDDNCDNCPTYPNAGQLDSDADEVGGVCEDPGNAGLLSQITAFESLMAVGSFTQVGGGTWTPGVDQVTGARVGGDANYLHATIIPDVDYSVETTFQLSNTDPPGGSWTGLVFGWHTQGGNLWSYECVYERSNHVSLYVLEGAGMFNYIGGVTVATTVTNDQWKRLRVFRDGDTVRCVYDDEAGGSDQVEISGADVWADMSGRSGVRIYNETAVFTSFVIYQ